MELDPRGDFQLKVEKVGKKTTYPGNDKTDLKKYSSSSGVQACNITLGRS